MKNFGIVRDSNPRTTAFQTSHPSRKSALTTGQLKYINRIAYRALKNLSVGRLEKANAIVGSSLRKAPLNKPGTTQVGAPVKGSKRTKCFEYAKGHYCEKFLSNLQNRKIPEGIPIRLENHFLLSWKHLKTQFFRESHGAEKPKRRTSKFVKCFFQAKTYLQMIFPKGIEKTLNQSHGTEK